MIEMESTEPLCLEKFTNYKALGKVTMRDAGKTIMSGVVTELII
jgi:peptide chain release factor subunit 3